MFQRKISLEMFGEADKELFKRAFALRNRMTACETIIWNELKKYRVKGVVFRRQHPFKIYILDFYCHKMKLAIEIDGEYHETEKQKENDQERTKDLSENGIQVLRFTNYEVKKSIHKVLNEISRHIENNKS